jgi:hypothetical protein
MTDLSLSPSGDSALALQIENPTTHH